jgi:hypothetical protein
MEFSLLYTLATELQGMLCLFFGVLSSNKLQRNQRFLNFVVKKNGESAGVAQLVEQRFCKPQVVGSSPFSSSIFK